MCVGGEVWCPFHLAEQAKNKKLAEKRLRRQENEKKGEIVQKVGMVPNDLCLIDSLSLCIHR